MSQVSVMKTSSGPRPRPDVESITPAKAEAYLKTMIANRHVSQAKVLEYAISMDEGKWSLNGETIKFNSDGQLFDGQQRLNACILAGKPFLTYVVRGINDPDAFATVDTGKARTHADVFAISGWQNNKIASAVAMVILLLEQKRVNWSGPETRVKRSTAPTITAKLRQMPNRAIAVSRNELVHFAEKNSEALQQAVRFAACSKAARLVPGASIAALYYVFRKIAPFDADTFFQALAEGAGLQKSDPVLVLREKLSRSKMSKEKLTRWAIIGFTIKTWNKRRANEPMQSLRVIEGERFPVAK